LIVQSALSGVTNKLETLLTLTSTAERQQVIMDISHQHSALARELDIALPNGMNDLLQELSAITISLSDKTPPAIQARLLALGELLASELGAAFLKQAGLPVQWLDARDLLQSEPLPGQSQTGQYLSAVCHAAPDTALADTLAAHNKVLLTQGFIACNADKETVVLGRGGSDTSAAYLAAILDAERLEIWTDVPGLFSANPYAVPAARLLHQVDYIEAQEIATAGGRVLHPRCIEPARQAQIPIHIRYTSNPALPGTVISTQTTDSGGRVKAILVRDNITLVSMETAGMWHQVGFLADAFGCFKQCGLSVDLVSTSETNVTVSLDPLVNNLNSDKCDVLDTLLTNLNQFCRARLITGCAAISLVGRQIRANLHRLTPALELFEERDVHLLSQAANDLNFTFVVNSADAQRLVRELHASLIHKLDDDPVFGPSWQELQAPALTSNTSTQTAPPWWQTRRDELLALSKEHQACYTYDLDTVRQAAERLQQLRHADTVFYSIKANPHPAILQTLNACDIGFECVSPGEIRHVQTLFPKLNPARILFTPNFAPRDDYAQAIKAGVCLTLDNMYPLRAWPDLFAGQALLLRVDPGHGAGHHRHVRTAGEQSKFGITLDDLPEAHRLAQEAGAKVVGLHAHAGSGILEPDAWLELGLTLVKAAEQFPDVRLLDLGGGLGVPEKPGQLPLDLSRLDEALGQLKTAIQKADKQYAICLEPGRYLVSEAGVLLAQVTQLKGKGLVRYVGVATGMNSLIRPALYGAYHRIVNLSRLDSPADTTCNVVGPICETGDILGYERRLPAPEEGDTLLVANAGAYGRVMSSNYNLRQPAVEAIL
ncbi:MAG TPA: bifunctional aspartate kinase/diaminopimelate decarboxylase, partial [Gammaproteobacteria bacterium]|nr:bifunctional aspartate kinase/diaminopimelate decarboxylase [Gammaproteobacteria bacterium]